MLNLVDLEKLVTELMEKAKVPGAAISIVHRGKLVYARGFGVTSIEEGGIPVTPGTIFRIGSTSKPLTSTAIMRLTASGLLELDTPIDEIMPNLELSVPGAVKEITVRKLLSHTAALPTAAEHYGSRQPEGLRQGIYSDVAGYPLVAPVGKIWSYSNPGINLAGYVAELVSGKSYTQLMQELVFDPLGMQRTTFDPTIAMTYPLAQSHKLDSQGNLQVEHHYADNTMHYPSGFIMSTVLDLANFAIMHVSEGRFGDQQILSPEFIQEMHQPHVRFASFDDSGYGLTLSSYNYKGVRVIGHGGRISSFACSFEFVPETGSAVVILANNSALWGKCESTITEYILDGLLDLPTEAPALTFVSPDRAMWDRYVGLYVGANTGMAEVSREGDMLLLEWQGQKVPLNAVRSDLYAAQMPDGQAVPVSFTLEDDAPARYINLVIQSGFMVALERLAVDANFVPDVRLSQSYVGTYENPLEKMSVLLEGDQLILRSPLFQGAAFPMRPVGKERFVFPVGLLTFESPDVLLLGGSMRFVRVASESTP